MWLFIMVLVFGSAVALSHALIPPISDKVLAFNTRRSKALAEKMDEMFIRVQTTRLVLMYTLGPLVLAALGYFLFPAEIRLIGVGLGLVFGFLGPGAWVKIMKDKRESKFDDQLIDALMVLSSSLKGGLSLMQAMEVVTEEMPDPIRQEFGTLLGENKMGVSLEEAFGRLYNRMPSTALHQMITAILLARETGGNLPVIFARIVETIRANKRIKQNLDNLTLQGRIQGIVMSLLPVAFAVIVFSTNKTYFDVMLNSDLGRMLLTYAVISELLGGYMIWKISVFKEF